MIRAFEQIVIMSAKLLLAAGKSHIESHRSGIRYLPLMSCKMLLSIKRKALRKRTWFSELSNIERGLINSVLNAFESVKSRHLVAILERIIAKLRKTLESGFARMVESVGWELVRRRILQAVSMGCLGARRWLDDRGFAEFLTVLELNTPVAFKA